MKQKKSFFSLGRFIQLIGLGFLLSGIFFLWAAPQEIYTFYAFIPGGKFHFEGFGFDHSCLLILLCCAGYTHSPLSASPWDMVNCHSSCGLKMTLTLTLGLDYPWLAIIDHRFPHSYGF
jgi:hypothetical protein